MMVTMTYRCMPDLQHKYRPGSGGGHVQVYVKVLTIDICFRYDVVLGDVEGPMLRACCPESVQRIGTNLDYALSSENG